MTIKLSVSEVKGQSQIIKNSGNYFKEDSLCPADEKTTLTANGNGKNAYSAAEKTIANMGNNIDIEANNIRSIGQKFEEYDSMLSKLWEDGYRYPTIGEGN